MINKDEIIELFGSMEEYQKILKHYLADENFKLYKAYIAAKDYALAIDTIKGLYILALDLRKLNLYYRLLDLYDALSKKEEKSYNKLIKEIDKEWKLAHE